MKLLVLSDLHREVWRDDAPRIDVAAIAPDVVVLAGDIDTGVRGIAWADAAFPGLPVLYVHGNHEGYGHALDKLQDELAEACRMTGHVHFLQRKAWCMGNVRFLGCTLWTDFRLYGPQHYPQALHDCGLAMNDYRRIRLASQGFRKMRPRDTEQRHAVDRRWLEDALAEPFEGKTVVITHMAPSARSVPDEYQGDSISAAYASHLDGLVEQADLWIHGHMHDSLDYCIGKCRVICNPLGYRQRSGTAENWAFSPHCIVDV